MELSPQGEKERLAIKVLQKALEEVQGNEVNLAVFSSSVNFFALVVVYSGREQQAGHESARSSDR